MLKGQEWPDDVCHYMMEFLDSRFIIGTCMTISRQFHQVAKRIKLSLDFSEEFLSNEDFQAMCNCPNLTQLTSLNLEDNFKPERLEQLIPFENLTYLNVGRFSGIVESAQVLKNMTQLKYLTIGIDDCTSIEHLKELQSIDISYCKNVSNLLPELKHLSSFMMHLENVSDKLVDTMKSCESLKSLTCLKTRACKHPRIQEIFKSPQLVNLTNLDVSFSNYNIPLIIATNGMKQLQHLTVDGLMNADSCKAFGESENFEHLTTLQMNDNRLTADEIKPMFSFHNLTSLSLSRNNLQTEGAIFLANCPTLKNLTQLDLLENSILTEGLKAIACSEILKNLTSINLTRNRLDANAMIYFDSTNGCKLTCLKELNLSTNPIEDNGVKSLIQCDCLNNLSFLSLNMCLKTTDCAKYVLSNLKMKHLTHLDLGENSCINDECIEMLSSNPHMSSLTILNLEYCCLTDEGVKIMSNSVYMSNLWKLYLRFNRFVNFSFDSLPSLNSFGSKEVEEPNLTNQLLNYLANSPFIHKLRLLSVYGTKLDKNAIEMAQKSKNMRRCRIVYCNV